LHGHPRAARFTSYHSGEIVTGDTPELVGTRPTQPAIRLVSQEISGPPTANAAVLARVVGVHGWGLEPVTAANSRWPLIGPSLPGGACSRR
jgi:hypothetical protein